MHQYEFADPVDYATVYIVLGEKFLSTCWLLWWLGPFVNFSPMSPKLLKTLPNEAISSLITRNALISLFTLTFLPHQNQNVTSFLLHSQHSQLSCACKSKQTKWSNFLWKSQVDKDFWLIAEKSKVRKSFGDIGEWKI